jgi:hypothetical protein
MSTRNNLSFNLSTLSVNRCSRSPFSAAETSRCRNLCRIRIISEGHRAACSVTFFDRLGRLLRIAETTIPGSTVPHRDSYWRPRPDLVDM